MVNERKKKSIAKYRHTAKGRAAQARSNNKSAGKRFILTQATKTELKQYENYIQARRKQLDRPGSLKH